MTFLFFAGLVIATFGFSSMRWPAILVGVALLVWSGNKLDDRQQAENRRKWDAWEKERMARGNGHPRGNVDLIVRSVDE